MDIDGEVPPPSPIGIDVYDDDDVVGGENSGLLAPDYFMGPQEEWSTLFTDPVLTGK